MQPRFVSILVALGALLLAGWFGQLIAEGNYFPLIMFAASIGGVALLAIPHVAGGLAFALYYSGISGPGIPGQFNLYYVLATGIVLAFALRLTLLHELSKAPRFAAYGLLVALWLAIVMAIRGAGFRILGSDTWGGMFYLSLFLGIAFVFGAAQVRLSPRHWHLVFTGMMLGALAPVIVDVLLIFGKMPNFLFMFIRPTGGIGFSMLAAQSTEGIVRYLSAGTAGVIVTLWIFSRTSFDRLFGRVGLFYAPLLALAFGLAAVSGFRIRILEIGLFVLFIGFLQRGWNFVRISFLVGTAVCGIAALYPLARHLPLPAQRSVAWLPGIEINPVARQDAEGTINWRIELWKRAIEEAPDFLWVGKGYAFQGEESLDAYTFKALDQLRWAVVTSSYHNGPLSMLVGLGVPGLCICVLWIVSMTRYALKTVGAEWNSPVLRLLFLGAASRLFVVIAIFFTLYGDVQASFPEFLYLSALMCALRKSDAALTGPVPERPSRAPSVQRNTPLMT